MNMPIRILHVIGAMDMGGAETLLMNIYRKIDRDEIQFDFVISKNEKCIFEDEIIKLGGKIYRCPKYYIYNFYKYSKWWNNFLIEHNEYRIIHGHIGSSAPVYLSVAKKHGLFTIAHSHATKDNKINIKNIIWRINSFQTRYIADYFFGCSRQAGIDRFGERIVNSNRFDVIKNGIDVDKFRFSQKKREEIRHKYNIKNELIIGNVSRLTYAKNHEFLIDVFKEINRINKTAKLLIVGDGELKQKIENRIMKYNLQNNVILTGTVIDTEAYYCAMDVFCFPSIYEGLGISLVEAQTSGLHCYVSNSIQNEAIVNEQLFHRISLSKKPLTWAEIILNNKINIDRKKIFIDKGYNINNSMIKLSNFYKRVNA